MAITEFQREKVLSIINSDLFHSLYGRWLDEHEYEDIRDYGEVIAKTFGVTIISASGDPFGFTIELIDRSRFEIEMRDKGDYEVGAFRPANPNAFTEAK